MKRINVESGVNIIINDNGRIPPKGFEVVKVRTPYSFKQAIRLFKALHSQYECVYMYQVATGYRVEFKTYATTLHEAVALRNEVEGLLEELEHGE